MNSSSYVYKAKAPEDIACRKKERVQGSFHFSSISLPWNMEHMPRYADLLAMWFEDHVHAC